MHTCVRSRLTCAKAALAEDVSHIKTQQSNVSQDVAAIRELVAADLSGSRAGGGGSAGSRVDGSKEKENGGEGAGDVGLRLSRPESLQAEEAEAAGSSATDKGAGLAASVSSFDPVLPAPQARAGPSSPSPAGVAGVWRGVGVSRTKAAAETRRDAPWQADAIAQPEPVSTLPASRVQGQQGAVSAGAPQQRPFTPDGANLQSPRPKSFGDTSDRASLQSEQSPRPRSFGEKQRQRRAEAD